MSVLAGLRLSRQNLARDLIGTLVPFSTVIVLLVLAGLAPVEPLLDAAKDLPAFMLPLALALYLAMGYFAGKLVGAFGVALTHWASRLPRIGERYSYAHWYARHRAPIDRFYERTFEGGTPLDLSLTDRVNALKNYYATIHPEGASAAMRQFMLMDITRAAFVYAAVLLGYELLAGLPQPMLAVLCTAVLVVTALATPRRIEKVVRTELVYLVAAARLKADRDGAKPVCPGS